MTPGLLVVDSSAALKEMLSRTGANPGSWEDKVVRAAFEVAAKKGYDVAIVQKNYNKKGCGMAASSPVHAPIKIVRIYYPGVTSEDLLWDLLHEIGHLLQGPDDELKLHQYDRESDAWKKALDFAQRIDGPGFAARRRSFEARQRKCLCTYSSQRP